MPKRGKEQETFERDERLRPGTRDDGEKRRDIGGRRVMPAMKASG